MIDDNSSGNPPPGLIDVSTVGTGKKFEGMGYGPTKGDMIDNWSNDISAAVDSLVATKYNDCEPLRSLVHAYLADKGIEFVTGAYYPHGLRNHPEDEPKLQIEIWDVSDKMLTQVILPELKKIAQDHQKKDVVVGATGDNLTWDFVSIRLE